MNTARWVHAVWGAAFLAVAGRAWWLVAHYDLAKPDPVQMARIQRYGYYIVGLGVLLAVVSPFIGTV